MLICPNAEGVPSLARLGTPALVCVQNCPSLSLVSIVSPASFGSQLQDWKYVLDAKSIS